MHGDECSRARCITFGAPRPPVPPTSDHLSCADTFAWSRGCPFMTGTTVVLRILPAVTVFVVPCTYVRTKTHTHTHARTHACTHTHTHTCTHTHRHTHTHSCMHTRINARTHTHIHPYMHLYDNFLNLYVTFIRCYKVELYLMFVSVPAFLCFAYNLCITDGNISVKCYLKFGLILINDVCEAIDMSKI